MEAELDHEQHEWQGFIATRQPALREKLIVRYVELVRMHAALLYKDRQVQEIEFDEYVQYGQIGLIEAIDRFDPDRGVKFSSYASHRIRGAILNGIEKFSEQQRQIAARKRLKEERFQELKNEVTVEESDPFLRLVDLAIGTAIGYMLEDSGMYHDTDEGYVQNIYRSQELKDLVEIFKNLIENLPETEQNVIKLHYYHHKPFEEIARHLKLSRGRISQLHHQALKRMRQAQRQLQFFLTEY